MNIPNEVTEQTFKDSDAGKYLIHCDDADDMFSQLGLFITKIHMESL